MTGSSRDEGFRRHEEEQRRAWAELSPLDRLRWLAQAKAFCRRFLGAAAHGAAPGDPVCPPPKRR